MNKGGWFTGRLVTAAGQPAAGFRVTAIAADELEVSSPPGSPRRVLMAGSVSRPLRPGKYEVYPGTGAGVPLQKAQGAGDTRGEVTGEGEAHELGDIVLPTGVKLAD